jgi:hypothetical protein
MSGGPLSFFRERIRTRRQERPRRAHAVRAGSPPGPADRMYFSPKAY